MPSISLNRTASFFTAIAAADTGIGNILERLHIYYDDDFMFEIDSAILVGTTVTIRVPYSRNDSPQIHAERPIGSAEQN